MALTFDSASSRYVQDPGTVAIVRDQFRTAVLLCDGSGSWGAGAEAAAWSLQFLERRWSGSGLPDLSTLVEDVGSLHSVVPKKWRESDFGSSFCFVLLYCSVSTVRYFAAGLYSVVLFDGSDLRTIFQPNTVGAELIKQKVMSEKEASRFRGVGLGPWIMDEALDPKMSEEVVLPPGHCLLVLHALSTEQLDTRIVRNALYSAAPAVALTKALGKVASAVIVAG
jgi:hypothetical protein